MDFEKEIIAIKERNRKVELDKTWETSFTRKVSIIGITYIFAYLVMVTINVPQPALNALIPTLGFFLSTLSLNIIKRAWVKLLKKTP
ncbi:MAG: hypothetical protein CMH30_06015 [Micavibrio sp.]|nr:hypothetical protein [Micavibrio sp.]|tara:strand:- start:173 stop:433 length:261 start_codon:yes stop_codon:yes gene_type:complete